MKTQGCEPEEMHNPAAMCISAAAEDDSDEHFTVDGTLLEAWVSHKSFRRRDDGPADPPPDDLVLQVIGSVEHGMSRPTRRI